MKIEYPVYDITGIDLYYDEDGTVYTHLGGRRGTLVIDCTTLPSEDFGIRRAILRSENAPMYPLKKGLPDVVAVVLTKARQIIDSKGQVFKLTRNSQKALKTYVIKEIYTGDEEGKYVLVLRGHTKRIVVTELPSVGNTFVTLLQDDRIGDVFAGYSSIPQERMVKA